MLPSVNFANRLLLALPSNSLSPIQTLFVPLHSKQFGGIKNYTSNFSGHILENNTKLFRGQFSEKVDLSSEYFDLDKIEKGNLL